MVLNSFILRELSKKVGCDVTTPAGCTNLHLEILKKNREAPSVNTIKRLTGVLPYSGKPNRSTLDLIANYLEDKTWPELLKKYPSDADQPLDFCTLPKGAQINIDLGSGQSIRLRHLCYGEYEVVESHHHQYTTGRRVQL